METKDKILYIFIFLLCGLLINSTITTCQNDAKYDNNIKALRDTIKYYTTKSGNVVAEKQGFIVDNSKEIKQLQEDLYNVLKEMKIQNSTIAAMQFSGVIDSGEKDTVYEIKHDTIKNGFIKDFSFSDKYRILDGNVTYVPDTLSVNINNDKIIFDYTVAMDNKNRIKIMSDNPYVKYNEISGFTLTPPKKKRFGIGVQIGYGYNFNGKKLSPYIGLGLSYNLITF